MFHCCVTWFFLAVSMVGAAFVVNVYFPIRREPLTVVSFALGWIPGELPVQVLVVAVAETALFVWSGALRGVAGWVALAVSVASWLGLVRLAVEAHRSKDLVDAALAEATGGPVLSDGVDARPVWNRWWRLSYAVPLRLWGIRRIRNVDYWGDHNYRHKLDIIRSRSVVPERAPVLIYVHGGGWMIGDKRQQGIPMMHELIARGWVCVAINYRLSPRATWPAHVVDCKRAVAWVREHIAEYGGDPEFIAISGGSAGGHLSALVALTPDEPEWQPGFEDADTSVDACVPFYGVYDLTRDASGPGPFGPDMVTMLEKMVFKVKIADYRDLFEAASPTYRVTPSAPPMFVLHGANDTLVPVTVAREFVARLREVSQAPVAYVELPCAQHAFDVLASIRCSHTSVGAVRFLEGVRSRIAP